MSEVRWLGFAIGLVLLLAAASSVTKTLLIPRSSRSAFASIASLTPRRTR